MDKKKIAVYGAGGFGREVAWLAETSTIDGKGVEVVCFIDDDESIFGSTLNDIEILSLFDAKRKYPDASLVSGIGVPKIRELTMGKARSAGADGRSGGALDTVRVLLAGQCQAVAQSDGKPRDNVGNDHLPRRHP